MVERRRSPGVAAPERPPPQAAEQPRDALRVPQRPEEREAFLLPDGALDE